MKKYLVGIYFSLPVQLFLLHFRRYQVFLLFWYILFATIAGNFMETFGAYSLYLSPEYLGSVSALSAALVGVSIGIFIMSWNITTFILHSKHIKFLATTAQPFLKYCINNAVIPLSFLLFYLFRAVQYDRLQELLPLKDIFLLIGGFTGGFILTLLVAFLYFFSADKTIYHRMAAVITTANQQYAAALQANPLPLEKREIRVEWFLSARLNLRKPRDVRHYSQEFLDAIFKRHHIAAVIAILLSFLFLIGIGFFSDNKVFQVPAAASITVFFAILIGVAGAFTLFLHSWSIPVLLAVYLGVNWMYQHDIIDVRNKAYGLNYAKKQDRPAYSRATIVQMAAPVNEAADKEAFLRRLHRWKARQNSSRPVMFLVNVSGGGTRSATFTMNVLQRLDSLLKGRLMQQTTLLTGASGGMLGAAYFRELYLQQLQNPSVRLQDKQYVDNISRDLLNPLFSAFVSRDMVGPAKKFRLDGQAYVKDRGYAFEQKLLENTGGLLNKRLGDYTLPEDSALIPTMLFNSVISRDGRKMVAASRPVRFLMRPLGTTALTLPDAEPDVIDFTSLFAQQNALRLRITSALRMNATFPYVLPNVWLPTDPVIDVMDAGLRDNFGQEISLRFMNVFRDWIRDNVSHVVLIQIRDRPLGEWDKPTDNSSILSFLTKPFLLLQNNWFKLQDYYQSDQLDYLFNRFGTPCYRVCFQYVPGEKEGYASLNFHLNASEKKSIAAALDNVPNQQAFKALLQLAGGNRP